MAARQDLIKGNIDTLLLSMISQQPMYGYQIMRELDGRKVPCIRHCIAWRKRVYSRVTGRPLLVVGREDTTPLQKKDTGFWLSRRRSGRTSLLP